MSSQLESLIERVLGELRHIVQTETIIGEPIQAGDVLLIPVSKISFGFGAGGQEDKGKGGTGGGATVQPIAFVVIDGDGKVQLLTLGDKEAGLGQLMELVPEALKKIRNFVGKKKDPEVGEEQDEDDGDGEADS